VTRKDGAPRPRDYLETPSHFGRYLEVSWLAVETDAERDALWAAQWQHRLAVDASEALVFREWTRDDLAQMLGRERQFIWDRFQGRTPMTLRDIAALERLLGVRVAVPGAGILLPIEVQVAPADDGQ